MMLQAFDVTNERHASSASHFSAQRYDNTHDCRTASLKHRTKPAPMRRKSWIQLIKSVSSVLPCLHYFTRKPILCLYQRHFQEKCWPAEYSIKPVLLRTYSCSALISRSSIQSIFDYRVKQ